MVRGGRHAGRRAEEDAGWRAGAACRLRARKGMGRIRAEARGVVRRRGMLAPRAEGHVGDAVGA